MLKFGEFISEDGYGVPVISISKDKVDLEKDSTRNEINRNIAQELSQQFVNPYSGWLKVGRILQMYSIFLPRIIFDDEEEGEQIVSINQFGDKWGADLTGKVTSPSQSDDEEFFLYYSYGITKSGFYKMYSVIVDEEELNYMLGNDEIDIDDSKCELDPRQTE